MGILLGFEIPTGARVEIPEEGHFAWFGQTQLSGKTTAFEAMVYRGGFKAVAFITKRGESSFLTARTIQPFFSEPSDDPEQPLWRWVQSILEASQRRRMNFEESWIIRACEEPRRAKSLADVQKNVRDLLSGERRTHVGRGGKAKDGWARKPVSGINAGVYTSLSAYFDIVMPQLARLPYATKLKLQPGLSVMDLREYSLEMQALVIRSVMEHVYRHERNTRVIVPEAQDFVPEGKNAPVKMACENLVRKGAADKNFMWLDSQDMAAVDKVMLRAVSVMGCGVQGEINEIERTVKSFFGMGVKPADIGMLKIGQFFVRVPGGEIRKVYVQPAWMDSEVHAQAIATGIEKLSSAKPMLRAFAEARKEETDKGDDAMWKEKYDELLAEHNKLIEAHDALAARIQALESAKQDPETSRALPVKNGSSERVGAAAPVSRAILADQHSVEAVYDYVIERARKDPAVLAVLASQPEILVSVSRPKIECSETHLRGRLALLISEGFFNEARTGSAAFTELADRRKFRTSKPNVYRECDALANLGFLVSVDGGYESVPSMKVRIVEAK